MEAEDAYARLLDDVTLFLIKSALFAGYMFLKRDERNGVCMEIVWKEKKVEKAK